MRGRFEFTVTGRVVGSARPRVTRHGTYIPRQTVAYRDRIRGEFIERGGQRMTGPLAVRVDVYRQLPKSRPRSIESEPDTFKPDVDNIAKNVLDALNRLAWDDDSEVTELLVVKHRRTRAAERIDVTITAL